MLEGLMSYNEQRPSLKHISSGRHQAGFEIGSQALAEFHPAAIIPGKTAQLFFAVDALGSGQLQSREMAVQAAQALLCGAQIGLGLYLLMSGNESCNNSSGVLCAALKCTQLLYDGILLTGWITAEKSLASPAPC